MAINNAPKPGQSHKRTAQGSGKNARYTNKSKRRSSGKAYRGQGR